MGDFSVFGRIFHQSSHIGDEFLLRTQLQRVNLSFEGVDLNSLMSFRTGFDCMAAVACSIRTLHRSNPGRYNTGLTTEVHGAWILELCGQSQQWISKTTKNDWRTDVSARAGVQFENLDVMGRHFQILLEYFNGHSPSG